MIAPAISGSGEGLLLVLLIGFILMSDEMFFMKLDSLDITHGEAWPSDDSQKHTLWKFNSLLLKIAIYS